MISFHYILSAAMWTAFYVAYQNQSLNAFINAVNSRNFLDVIFPPGEVSAATALYDDASTSHRLGFKVQGPSILRAVVPASILVACEQQGRP